MDLGQFLKDQTVIMVLQLVVGKLWKNNPNLENKFIPWVSYVLSLIGYNILPATAHAAASSTGLTPYVSTAVLAALQTVFVTGFHGTFKNAISPFLKNAARAVAIKFLESNKEVGQ